MRMWVILLFACIPAGCTSNESAWTIDGEFSNAISVGWHPHQIVAGEHASTFVKTIEVYESTLPESDVVSVEEIRELSFVAELVDKASIQRFLVASGSLVGNDVCDPFESGQVYHVLGFDPENDRAGYFRFYPCPDKEMGSIRPLFDQDNSVHFSRELFQVLNEITRTSLEK